MSDRKSDFPLIHSNAAAGVIIAAAVLILLFALNSAAHAHRVIVFAWIDGKTVHTTSKFPGGNQVSGGTIKIYDDAGKLLLTGTTDDQGKFSFPIPKKSALRIVMAAGPGHQGEWRLSEKEVRMAFGETKPSEINDPQQTPAASAPAQITKDPVLTKDQQERIAQMIEQAVKEALAKKLENALDKKLAPVMQILTDLRQPGPSANDIFGGIGYIVGLFGMAAYIYSRRR